MRPVTLQDVARQAGVSQPTASRVLNGSARVPGEGVAERVRQAAVELGYVPNAQAQALARASTALIGLVVHDIADPYFSTIASGVQRAARERQRVVLLASTNRDPVQEREAVTAFISHRADALLLVGSRRFGRGTRDQVLESELKRYRDNGGRIAVIGQAVSFADSIVPQNRDSAAALAESLHRLGHRRFAVLTGPPDLQTAVDRVAGFTEALARLGIKPLVSISGQFTRDGGLDASARLVQELNLVRGGDGVCVFAVNDVMAIGAAAGFREAGLRIPGDVQIAGFDDIITLRDHIPSLTTVRLPLMEMGERAVDMVLTDGLDSRPRSAAVPGQIVLRDSTRLGKVTARHPGGN